MVAIEAKNILVKIIEIEKLNNSITNILHLRNNEIEKIVNKIIDFQSKTDELHRDFDIFKELIENEINTSDAMNKYLSQSARSILRYKALVERDNSETSIHIVAMGLQKEHIRVGMNIKKKLRDYVLYKNKNF